MSSEKSWRPAHLALLDRRVIRGIAVRWVSEDPKVQMALPAPRVLWVPSESEGNVESWVLKVGSALRALSELTDLQDLEGGEAWTDLWAYQDSKERLDQPAPPVLPDLLGTKVSAVLPDQLVLPGLGG